MKKYSNRQIGAVVAVVVILLVIAAVIYSMQNERGESRNVATTTSMVGLASSTDLFGDSAKTKTVAVGDEVNSQKTYRNDEQGIKFKYPSGWLTPSEKDFTDDYVIGLGPDSNSSGIISIDVLATGTLDYFKTTIHDVFTKQYPVIVSESKVRVGSYEATVLDMTSSNGKPWQGFTRKVLIAKGNRVYIFTTSSNSALQGVLETLVLR